MKKILFVNGCARAESRTLQLARAALEKIPGQVEEIALYEQEPMHLTPQTLSLRTGLAQQQQWTHPLFDAARQFAQADEIVVAAPYWDLLFPAVVRSYLEAVTVSGLTFVYGEDGRPRGLCRAERLTYVTTSGGPIVRNFGFEYVDALAHNFYGIPQTRCIKAEGLDIFGADAQAIVQKAIQELV